MMLIFEVLLQSSLLFFENFNRLKINNFERFEMNNFVRQWVGSKKIYFTKKKNTQKPHFLWKWHWAHLVIQPIAIIYTLFGDISFLHLIHKREEGGTKKLKGGAIRYTPRGSHPAKIRWILEYWWGERGSVVK